MPIPSSVLIISKSNYIKLHYPGCTTFSLAFFRSFVCSWRSEWQQCWLNGIKKRNSVTVLKPASNGNGVGWWHSCQQPLITQKVWKRKLTLALWLAAERHYQKNNNLDAIYGPDCCSKREWRSVPGFSPGEVWNPSVTAGSRNLPTPCPTTASLPCPLVSDLSQTIYAPTQPQPTMAYLKALCTDLSSPTFICFPCGYLWTWP